MSLPFSVHFHILLYGKELCINTSLIFFVKKILIYLLSLIDMKGGLNMSLFNFDGIQDAVVLSNNRGLCNFMFQDPFSNNRCTSRKRRTSRNQRRTSSNRCTSRNQRRTSVDRCPFRNQRRTSRNRCTSRNQQRTSRNRCTSRNRRCTCRNRCRCRSRSFLCNFFNW